MSLVGCNFEVANTTLDIVRRNNNCFTNLLPLPALDGSRLVFVFYEMLTSRRFSPSAERLIQGAGAIALLVSMVLLSINDLRHPLF